MPETQIKCPICGAEFAAPSGRAQVFCVECGQAITRIEEPAAPRSKTFYDEAADLFREIRFPIVDRKTGLKGDRLIELWTLLFYHSKNSLSNWGIRTARKEINSFFEHSRWQIAMQKAGEGQRKLLIEQLLDSAAIYIATCRDDSKYGSKILGIGRMSSEEIAQKSSREICDLIRYLLKLELPGESRAIIHGVIMSFPRVFVSQREALAQAIKENLTESENQMALQIVAEIAEYNRVTQY